MPKPTPVRKSKIVAHQNRAFALCDYDPNWPKEFETRALVIRDILQDDAVAIEHIGSTSIPGMVAKPQIDILVTVKSLTKMRDYYDSFTEAGYTPRGDYTGEGEEYFTKDDTNGTRLVSVHVLPVDHPWAADLINFRDYLRTHSDQAKRYGDAKRDAVQKHNGNYNTYYQGKLSVIQDLRQQAADWRERESNK